MRLKNRDNNEKYYFLIQKDATANELSGSQERRKFMPKFRRVISSGLTAFACGATVFAMTAVAVGDTSEAEADESFKVGGAIAMANLDTNEDPVKFSDLVTVQPMTMAIASTTVTTSTTTATTTTSTSTTSSTTEATTTTACTEAETECVADECIDEPVNDSAETEEVYYEGSGYEVSDYEIVMLARTVAQEAGDCSYEQQACVIWTVLNRVDNWRWPNTIAEVVSQPSQFAYYSYKEYREDHYQVAYEQVNNWINGGPRYLDPIYIGFYGDGWRNHFYDYDRTVEYCPD